MGTLTKIVRLKIDTIARLAYYNNIEQSFESIVNYIKNNLECPYVECVIDDREVTPRQLLATAITHQYKS